MKTLLIYDSKIDIDKLSLGLFNKSSELYFFPLTSCSSLTEKVYNRMTDRGIKVELADTSALVNSAAAKIRQKYIDFISGLAQAEVFRNKRLTEYFAINKDVSSWWFSLVAEKNTFKSNSFNSLTQWQAVIDFAENTDINRLIFCCRNNKLRIALEEFAKNKKIIFKQILLKNHKNHKITFRQIGNFLLAKHLAHLVFMALRNFRISQTIKSSLKDARQTDLPKAELAIITPYPNFDITYAKKGVFKNKFYGLLQEALESRNEKVCWIAMYVQNNSLSLRESLEYAKKIIGTGNSLYFLEEYCSLSMHLKSFGLTFLSCLKFLFAQRRLRAMHTFGKYNFFALFKDDWYSSFCGSTSYFGVLYYNLFKKLFREHKFHKCLYSCEMQAWEKALIEARNSADPQVSLYAYQAGTISRFLLNYFNHPDEILNKEKYAMPKPDMVACNSRLTYGYMRESGWPENRLAVVEAYRYNYLRKHLVSPCVNKKENIVLVALSISPEESISILNMVCEAFKGAAGLRIWIKPHPFLLLNSVFQLDDIQLDDRLFEIKYDPVENLLCQVKVIIAGETGVSLEALALGCKVITIDSPEWINMSPLNNSDTSIFAKNVGSPLGVRLAVSKALNSEALDADMIGKIINQYFYFNEKTDLPENFLKILSKEE